MSKRNRVDLEEHIEKIIKNATSDRAVASALSTNIVHKIIEDPTRHREFGLVAAKYIEAIQRSNEQLIRAGDLLRRYFEGTSSEITEEDSENLYDQLQEIQQQQKNKK